MPAVKCAVRLHLAGHSSQRCHDDGHQTPAGHVVGGREVGSIRGARRGRWSGVPAADATSGNILPLNWLLSCAVDACRPKPSHQGSSATALCPSVSSIRRLFENPTKRRPHVVHSQHRSHVKLASRQSLRSPAPAFPRASSACKRPLLLYQLYPHRRPAEPAPSSCLLHDCRLQATSQALLRVRQRCTRSSMDGPAKEDTRL